MNKDNFIELLKLPSRGGHNSSIHTYIKAYLDTLGIKYNIFDKTTIYNIDNPALPFLSAHTDTVRTEECDKVAPENIKQKDYQGMTIIENKGHILGGDDMCGVFLILSLLEEGNKFNFVFTDGEETMNGSALPFVRTFKDTLSQMPYALVLDRKGSSDIICSYNRYGSPVFEGFLVEVGKEFGYSPEIGMCSDADFIRNVLATANLSVGYERAHSKKELVVWEHMIIAHDYVSSILERITEKQPKSENIFTTYFEDMITSHINGIIKASGIVL